jgi:hypothetical protein
LSQINGPGGKPAPKVACGSAGMIAQDGSGIQGRLAGETPDVSPVSSFRI